MTYQISKAKRSVELHLAGQPTVRGNVFLHEFCNTHLGAERVSELLTGADPFFPFQLEDGQFRLIRKTAVQRIVVDAEFELEILRSYGHDAMISRSVEVAFSDGQMLKGTLLVEPREGASRTLDELNRGKGFVLLHSNDVVHLINVLWVTSVVET